MRAYLILDQFGLSGYKVFALAYLVLLGIFSAGMGYHVFRKGDLP